MAALVSYPLFKLDWLSIFLTLAVGVFFILTILYSISFMKGRGGLVQYYFYIVLTAAASIGAIVSNNLMLLLIFWGFLGLTLFLLINMGDKDSSLAAKKSLIIVGGSDALMILGVGMIYYLTGTVQMDKISLPISHGPWPFAAYLCLAIACFAKAGAMPFHSWIPDCAKSAPIPVTAYLPASLDKLLGIYLLVRISLDIFVMNSVMNNFLMLIGAFTILAAVMIALVQHNMKKLLGYHAVSQVGYMVLGIGTGNPIGIAGGLFHMLNHAVYKSCLFFTAGNVEYRAKTSELDELGGLAKLMPITYISCLVASLSISGIPPFNGFVSKWLIYQGLISKWQMANGKLEILIAIFCLTAAMFGSGLTLASFMKLLHAAFLGQGNITPHPSPSPQRGEGWGEGGEVPWTMWGPCVILAAICILFGIFAFSVPLKYFIFPVVSTYMPVGKATLLGIWSPKLATLLVAIGLVFGFIIFKLSRVTLRQDAAFYGSETASLNAEETMVTGTEFYDTVKEIGWLRGFYARSEKGLLDVYEQGKTIVFGIGRFFQYLHNGVLPTYLVWTLLGMIILFFALVR